MLLCNEDFLLKIFALYELKTYFCITNTVGIAQLVRALDCGSRGRRFEPDYLPASKGFSVMRGFFFVCSLLNLDKDFSGNWQHERIWDRD